MRKRTLIARAVRFRLGRVFVLALFMAGPGTGLALAVHLHNHAGDHLHDSDECHICIQLTTSAKSPTLELPTVIALADDLILTVPCRPDRVVAVTGFSVFAPRAPPLF